MGTIFFVEGFKIALIPEARVVYSDDQRVGDELSGLEVSSDGKLRVSAFASSFGPAQIAGVRAGWHLAVDKTIGPENPDKRPELTEEELRANPTKLLDMKGVTLVFELAQAELVQHFEGSAKSWPRVEIPGDTAVFSFETDGDGSTAPEARWGVTALVVPSGTTMSPNSCRAEPRSSAEAMWRHVPRDQCDMGIRASPRINGKKTGKSLAPGVEFLVAEELRGDDGILYLKLADGRGWVFEGRPGVSLCEKVDNSLEAFFMDWYETTKRTEGVPSKPVVGREGWNEARLRALCKSHGWEFEWMTEDGERRRRAGERLSVTQMPANVAACIKRCDTSRPDGFKALTKPASGASP